MFKSKTLFVVGAGASQEAGLPVGISLKDRIVDKLSIRFNYGYDQRRGDRELVDALRHYVNNTSNNRDINPYLTEAAKIATGLPLAISIDNFLDAHSDNEKLIICGKFAIAKAILEAEQQSNLALKIDNNSKVDLNLIKDTWYIPFFQILTENLQRNKIENIFDNISFIVFNYDRCIENYLFYAIQSYYAISESDAAVLLNRLEIFHPYGAVGRLPWQEPKTEMAVGFGSTPVQSNLAALAGQIHTFAEQFEDKGTLTPLKGEVQNAEQIIFLGFAFHDLNMVLLTPGQRAETKRVLATAYGMSNSDVGTVYPEIWKLLKNETRVFKDNVTINSGTTCRQFFREYWRTLSRPA